MAKTFGIENSKSQSEIWDKKQIFGPNHSTFNSDMTWSTWIEEHHSRETSAVFEHCHATGHNINPHNVKVLSEEK